MSRYEVKISAGDNRVFLEENGFVMSAIMVQKRIKPPGDFKKHLQNVKTTEIRDDDVFVATYPKSGTHWIWEIINMLLKREATYEEKSKETAMLEFLSVEEVEKLPSPRILNCHYPVHLIPEGILKKRCKIVHVMRNFKDVLVSLLNHANAFLKQMNKPQQTLEDVLSLHLGEHGFYNHYPWFKYVREWEKLGQESPDQVLNISFEDMKMDSVKEIRKVAAFLGLDCTEELISEIAEKCSFKNLKQADINIKVQTDPTLPIAPGTMYRKGEVGDWKNWFTVAQNERIDKWLEENLKHTDLKFTYTL